jgi:hypothetical protein
MLWTADDISWRSEYWTRRRSRMTYCLNDGHGEPDQMPWTADDAERHTHKATTRRLKELWAKVANECLERTGDEGRAIREANAVVARQAEASY